MRYASLKDLVEYSEKIEDEFLREYLEKHQDDEYKIVIEEKPYSVKVKDIINFITINDDYYQRAEIRYTPSSDMPNVHFKYAVLRFFKDNFIDKKLCNIIDERLNEISRDEDIKLINKLYKSNDPNLPKILVNPKLKEAIFKDMPNYGHLMFEAIYIYIKMCKLLTYDDEFFASNQKGEIAELHQNINHLSEITPENNKVVCYEFASIYEVMLKEIGIPSEIIKSNDDLDTYGNGHTAVTFKVYGNQIIADSTSSILQGDLFAAKLNLKLYGIRCISGLLSEREFFKCIDTVYDDIHKTESENISKPQNIDSLLEEYQCCTENIRDVSLKDRIYILINKTNSLNLKGVDCLAYLLYLKGILFPGELANNVNINLIRDNTCEKTTARAILVINGLDEESNKYTNYYSYMPNEKLIPISLDELQLMFDNNDLGYIHDDEKHVIDGIKVR